MPMHARTLVLIAGILFPIVLPAPAIPSEARCSVNAAIDSISYKGEDSYLITVSLSFTASENALIKGFGEYFFIQTDRGWASLKASDRGTTAPPAGNASGAPEKVHLLLSIPLNTRDLFRTYEGDISLRHTLSFVCSDGGDGESRKEEERLYWITPRTSKWILREGM